MQLEARDRRRVCPFCADDNTAHRSDHGRTRTYECLTCCAVEVITRGYQTERGSFAPGWYHGWQQPDTDDQPGDRINADGVRSRAPIRFMEWAGPHPADEAPTPTT